MNECMDAMNVCSGAAEKFSAILHILARRFSYAVTGSFEKLIGQGDNVVSLYHTKVG